MGYHAKCEQCEKLIPEEEKYFLMGTMAFGRPNSIVTCMNCFAEMQQWIYARVVNFCEEKRKHLQFKDK
jgi:hypothetical protein